ncbi:MAG: N-acetylglucosamine kinase [Candidatus Kapaibacterium sp.]
MDSTAIYLGFDGGGSTSRFLMRRGEAVPQLYTFALNLKYSDLGIEESVKGFSACLNNILGAEISLLKGICISLSGASDEVMNKQFEQALQNELNLPELKIHSESDSSFALETAYPGNQSGMLLIAGTGSVAIAKKHNGEVVRVGGWGRLLGDEGSGYWIGLQALKHYCKVMDGAESAGELFVTIGQKLHDETGSNLSPLRDKLYREEIKPQHYAPLVFESLPADSSAEDILFDAAGNLMIDLESLWNKVSAECEPIITFHGAIARQPFIADYFEENCEAIGLTCKMLEGERVLYRALLISMSLS